jgi:hypothetical protein
VSGSGKAKNNKIDECRRIVSPTFSYYILLYPVLKIDSRESPTLCTDRGDSPLPHGGDQCREEWQWTNSSWSRQVAILAPYSRRDILRLGASSIRISRNTTIDFVSLVHVLIKNVIIFEERSNQIVIDGIDEKIS